MSTNFQDISGAIVTKLSGVSGLNGVYNYEPDKPTEGAYPFATVSPINFDGEFGDTIRNIRKYTFAVRIYQERTTAGFGNQKTERIMRVILDEVITAFDNDTTLSGMVKWVKPVSGDFTYEDREIGDTRVAEITIEANSVVDSTT